MSEIIEKNSNTFLKNVTIVLNLGDDFKFTKETWNTKINVTNE